MRTLRHALPLVSALTLSCTLGACSEARYLPDVVAPDGAVPTDALVVDESPARPDAPREDTAREDTRGTPDARSNPPGGAHVVVNEVNAQGADWIELFNAGDSMADLSMHYVADSNSDGAPRVDHALRFPMGATLAPGAYLFVRADVSGANAMPQTDCAPGPSPCFHVSWGISASNGETVFLLGSDETELDRFAYGADAAPAERSLARLPNGTGAPAVATPTPGAANRGP